MTFFWTNVTQVPLLGDISRHSQVPSVASGRFLLGQAGAQSSSSGVIWDGKETCRILFPLRPWEGESPGEHQVCEGGQLMPCWVRLCACQKIPAAPAPSRAAGALCARGAAAASPASRALSPSLQVKSLFFFRGW